MLYENLCHKGRTMNARNHRAVSWGMRILVVACIGLACLEAATALAQRPSTDGHVRELARYLNGVKIAEPIVCRQLAIYPVLVDDVPMVRGRWRILDDAVSRGVLVVSEKGEGSVPVVWVENRSRDDHVFIMTGEVISGGKQTRTVRHDCVLVPGQKVDLEVFCVEAHRWAGEAGFSAGSKTMLPQSIQGELRMGADQAKVWSEVARNNAALKAENATGSLETALRSAPVREKLDEVRRRIVPEIPRGTTGFIFVDRGRALGAEFFGREDLARELLPKLLDSYAVDFVILRGPDLDGRRDDRVAIEFFERVCRTGSEAANTPGSGTGIRTRQRGLLGDGVSLDATLVHFGVQLGGRVAPRAKTGPTIIYPAPQQ